MAKRWAIVLIGFFLIGKAEAKLGQTLDEIKKGLNNKELVQVEEETYPKDIIKYRAENVRQETGGFDFVRYSFFKNQVKRGNKCIRINYHKIYERLDEIPLLKSAEAIISKNFESDISKWEEFKSKGFQDDKNVPEEFLGWYGLNGEESFASINERSTDKKFSLTVVCSSPEYSEFEAENKYQSKSLLGKLLHTPSDKTLISIYSNALAGKISKWHFLFEIGVFILSTGIILGGWVFAFGLKNKATWLKIFALVYFVCGLLATALIIKNLFAWLGLLVELLKTNLGK